MITYEEALSIVFNNSRILSGERVPVEDSVGRVLKEDIHSPLAMPPFDKAAMDGYAVIASDVRKAPVRLRCAGIIQAGENFKRKLISGQCVKIMTGAPLPKGSDSVIMVEDTRQSGEYVELLKPVEKLENVCRKGEDLKRGQKVIEKGTRISSSHVALLAAVGRDSVIVVREPKVALLNTGGEIVPVGARLGKNKIYNSNGPTLSALLKSDGIVPNFLGIAKDETDDLKAVVKKGLQADILLISGGVSMGEYDLVPEILETMGVKKLFHKVSVKPGKPLFFGRYSGPAKAQQRNTIIFGIPGNPVANFSTYLMFIRPAIHKMMGYDSYEPVFKEGVLDEEFRQKPGRKHFVPVRASKKGTRYYLKTVGSHGSADILALARANGFMVAGQKISIIRKGSRVPFITW